MHASVAAGVVGGPGSVSSPRGGRRRVVVGLHQGLGRQGLRGHRRRVPHGTEGQERPAARGGRRLGPGNVQVPAEGRRAGVHPRRSGETEEAIARTLGQIPQGQAKPPGGDRRAGVVGRLHFRRGDGASLEGARPAAFRGAKGGREGAVRGESGKSEAALRRLGGEVPRPHGRGEKRRETRRTSRTSGRTPASRPSFATTTWPRRSRTRTTRNARTC